MRWDAVLGAAELAMGRLRGIARFAGTRESFLASLAPLLALPIVGAIGVWMQEGAAVAATLLLMAVVAQLGPAVVSHAVAAWWGREADWLRYATAYNWCQWALPVLLFGVLIVVQAVAGGELPEAGAAGLFMGVAGYALFLHVTVVRAGLGLGWGRAAVFVVLVNGATAAMVLAPHWVARLVGP